jgi:hypothetical protein
MYAVVNSLLVGLLTTLCMTQTLLEGKVLDTATQTPLEGVTVSVNGQPVGVTNREGVFTVSLSSSPAQTQLTFSSIGYHTLSVPANQLPDTIRLEMQTYLIGEQVITYTDIRKLLVRKWKIDRASLDAVTDNILERYREKDPKKAKNLAKNRDMLRQALAMARYEFRTDGEIQIYLLVGGRKLRWALDEEERVLTITDKTGKESDKVIRELTSERLVMENRQPGGERIPLVFVPVR